MSGENEDRKSKQLILNVLVESCSNHHSPGLWRHPDDRSWNFNNLEHWIELARLLESAKFHGIFIADVLGGYDVYQGSLDAAVKNGSQWPVHEPLAVVSAMASATKSIGFGVTVATTYEEPYSLARRLSTIDHLTKGRSVVKPRTNLSLGRGGARAYIAGINSSGSLGVAETLLQTKSRWTIADAFHRLGWNIVTGYLDSAARNLGHVKQPEHDKRYAVAEEYIKVMYKLFNSSWRNDAVVLDKQNGFYAMPDRVRKIDHAGEYYNVPGPHICQPSPQRTPLLLQAGTSKSGKIFAAQHAEIVFVAAHDPRLVAGNIADIRNTARDKFGRDPARIKFLAMLCPVIGKTEEEAKAKYADYMQYASKEGFFALFGGWTGIDMAKYGEDEELRHVESNAMRSAVEGWTSAAGPRWTKNTVAEHHAIGALGARCVGSPSQVADELQRWVDVADIDGFNLSYAVYPGTFEDVIELLIPELRRRKMFWEDYAVPGGTYRENFYQMAGQKQPLDEHVASKYRWHAGVSKDEHKIPE